MIYLDNGATTLHKPDAVMQAVLRAMETCSNPGRGGYPSAMLAAKVVYQTRETAGKLFDCDPEQVVFTSNGTHGLNMAIRTLVKPGAKVVTTGFEHNAVTRSLHLLGAQSMVAGRRLFDWENTLEEFEAVLKKGASAAVFTHASNVFGYLLPVEQMAQLCRQYRVPFVVDAAQSAGAYPVKLKTWGADFVAMPGHKGLLGPQGTGILLCGDGLEPLLAGGTGSDSLLQDMPEYLPERGEAGTLNVPGIAGLGAAMSYLQGYGQDRIRQRESYLAKNLAGSLAAMGIKVFSGPHQTGTVSFLPGRDCEEVAAELSKQGICVRGGLHCAPLAHESAGTLETGTVRVSFGWDSHQWQSDALIRALSSLV